MKSKIHPLAGILAVFTTTVIPVIAATGTLDATFGTGGTSLISFGATETANAVAIAPDGKIVVVGTTNVAGNNDIAVLRYNANGTLDTSFSSDGGTTTDVGAATADTGSAVVVQPDGKILVAGTTGGDIVVIRYNTDGSLDSFFSGGKVVTNVGGTDVASSIVLQNDGKVVVGGTNDIGDFPDFSLVRYNADGTLDTSFSSDGKVDFGLGSNDFCQAIALQADGKIVMAGYTDNSGTNDFAVARVTTTGALDITFDSDGTATTAFSGDDRASSVVIQPNGAIVVAGSQQSGSDIAIARYLSTGALDTTFSADGKQVIAFPVISDSSCNGLALQSDGKLLLAGITNAFGTNDFALARVNSDGNLDSTFATNGLFQLDISIGGSDQARAIALQADGRPIIAGNSLTDMAVVRLNTLASADASVGPKASAPIGVNIFNSTGSGQTLSIEIPKSGGSKTSFVKIVNKGHEVDSFNLGGTAGNSKFIVEYFNGKTNVSTAVRNGTFNTGSLASGASFLLKVKITAKTGAANKKVSVLVTGTSVAATVADTVNIKAKSK